MKIKCPFEPFDTAPDYTERELSIHLHEDHETREIIADYYCRLLFKIHEKIEEFVQFLTSDDGSIVADKPMGKIIQAKIDVLKSILENER